MRINRFSKNIFKLIAKTTLLFIFFMLVSYFFIMHTSLRKIQTKLKTSVSSASQQIDGDILKRVWEKKDMNSNEYKTIQRQLIDTKSYIDAKYIYTLYVEDDSVYFIVDGSSIEAVPLGEEYILRDEMKKAMNGEITVLNSPIEDKWGYFSLPIHL